MSDIGQVVETGLRVWLFIIIVMMIFVSGGCVFLVYKAVRCSYEPTPIRKEREYRFYDIDSGHNYRAPDTAPNHSPKAQ